MFKKFKDKLAEEMKQSPARLQASMQQLAQAVVSPSLSNSSIQDLSSKDNFSLTEETDETPKNSPAKHGFQTVDLTPPSVNSGSSRRSSISSNVSDASFLFPIYESSPGSMYHFQSDMDQSASEIDDNISPQLDRVSKEQLYSAYRKARTKYDKYRGRFTDLVTHYREIERAKTKLESLLVETQDKALRRISDLKEQCQLEQQAKAHLEEALRNDIEEKDHVINSLRTKIKLIQEKGPNAESLENMAMPENHVEIEKVDVLVDLSNNVEEEKPDEDLKLSTENTQLKERLQKLESLGEKYKDMLKRSKDKILEITNEKNTLERDYDLLQKSSKEKLDSTENELFNTQGELKNLREEIDILKKREEESVISLAENKLSIHRELEVKEEQIKKLQLELKQFNDLEKSLRETVEVQKQEIERIKVVANQNAEANQEHLRGKSEAVQKMQVEMQKKIDDLQEKLDEEVNTNKHLQMKLEEENKEKKNYCEIIEKLNQELIEKQKLCIEMNKKKEEYEKLLEDHKNQNEILEKELNEVKNIMEKLQLTVTNQDNSLKNNYEEELKELKKSLEEKSEICEKSNKKIQEYKEALELFKRKLQAQNEEIKSLKNDTTNDEKLLRLQDELENKDTEILGLTSELKSSTTTITDLKKEINNLVNNRKNLLKNFKACKKAVRNLKNDYASLKKAINNDISVGKCVILETKDKTIDVFSALNQENTRLKSQVTELTEKNEKMKEIQNNFDDKNIELNRILEEETLLRNELKERCNTIDEMQIKLNNYSETELNNSQFSKEIEHLQSKLVDLEKSCHQFKQMLHEAEIEKGQMLQEIESWKQKNEEILNNLTREISYKEASNKELENVSQRYEEVLKLVETLKSENKDQGNLINEIQNLRSEFNSLKSEYDTKNDELKILQAKNVREEEQLSEMKNECEHHKNVLEESNKRNAFLSEELKNSREISEKLKSELHELQDSLQKTADTKTTLMQKLKAFKEKLQKNTEEKNSLLAELDEEKAKFKSLENELNQSINSKTEEIEILQQKYSKSTAAFDELQASKGELDSLKNEKADIVIQLNEVKSRHDLLLDENRNLKDNQNDLMKLNEVLKQSQSELSKKVGILENKNRNVTIEKDTQSKELDAIKKQLQCAYSEMENYKIQLGELDEVKSKNLELTETVNKVDKYQEKISELEEEIRSLGKINTALDIEVKSLKNTISDFEKNQAQNANLNHDLQIYKEQIAELEKYSTSKVQELKLLCSNLESETDNLRIRLKEKDNELNDADSKNDRLLEEIDNLSSTKLKLEDEKNREIEQLQQELEESVKTLLTKESELVGLHEQYLHLKEQITNLNQVNENDAELAKSYEALMMEKRKLESQLDETLVTFQARETQIQAMNEELRTQTIKLQEQLKVSEEEQSLRVKQIVKEFQAQLHDKEEELQAALEKRFDRQQNYETDIILEYKEQLKDFQIELTRKSEEIERLISNNQKTKEETQIEIEKFLSTINQMKLEHTKEIEDLNQQWRDIVKNKTTQLEHKHELEIADLTNEWQNERKTDEKTELLDEELENTTRVAMATVQSNTGSFHTLQQTLLSQKKELAELRKLVKLKQDSVEDSTEIEYLRNILYKYMMGKETMVLARVIAAVVKFDQEQTTRILKKEEDKLSLLGSLGFT